MEIITGSDLFKLVDENKARAFTEFYNQFFQKLLLASNKYVKDIYVAEEIVQDIFLKIWEDPESLNKVISIKSYLYRAVVNAGINHLNRQKNIDIHHQKIAAELTEEYLVELDEENELVMILHKEIEKLPPQCRKIFKLNRFEHLKYKQIAIALDISERTVENHIANALKILRKALLSHKSINKSSMNYHLMITSCFF